MAFDFVTGNHERLSNSLQAAAAVWRAKKDRKVQGITLAACRKPDCVIDNAFVTGDGKLVLVDNNSAFAYDRNMMDALPWMLDDTCIFPARFVEVSSAMVYTHHANTPSSDVGAKNRNCAAVTGPPRAVSCTRWWRATSPNARCPTMGAATCSWPSTRR